MTPNDSWSEEEETTPQEPQQEPEEPGQKTAAKSAAPIVNPSEDAGGDEAWCEVSHHRKKKTGAKGGDFGEGGKGSPYLGRGGYNSPTMKGAKGKGKKGSKDDKSPSKDDGRKEEYKSPLKEASNTPSMSPLAKAEGKPLPPWRRQNQSSPTDFPSKDPTGEAHSPQKSGGYGSPYVVPPRGSPKSPAFTSPGLKFSDQEAKELANDPDLALPPIAVSFRALHKDKGESSPTKELYRAHRGDRGEEHASPEKHHESPTKDHSEDKEEGKRRVRDDVHEEVNALVDTCDALQRSDFDGKARQFLHAIHNLGGRQGVHDALHMIEISTNKKSRDSVRNWNGYISTLLQKYFQEIGGGKKNSERREKLDQQEEKGEPQEKGEDKEPKDLPKTDGPPAALAGSLTAVPLVFGPSRARAKA